MEFAFFTAPMLDYSEVRPLRINIRYIQKNPLEPFAVQPRFSPPFARRFSSYQGESPAAFDQRQGFRFFFDSVLSQCLARGEHSVAHALVAGAEDFAALNAL